MFRELTYEELEFVSGGQDKNPPPPPPPPVSTETDGNEITVTYQLDSNWSGGIVINMETAELVSLNVAFAEGGFENVVSFDPHDHAIGDKFTYNMGNGTNLTFEIQAGSNGYMGKIGVYLPF